MHRVIPRKKTNRFIMRFSPKLQMKLPLKRFHQGEFNETVTQNSLQEGGEIL